MRWIRRLLFVAAFVFTSAAGAQGCSQCREAVGQTPEKVQRAYRTGIGVMVCAALFVCGATVAMARRHAGQRQTEADAPPRSE